MLEDRTKVTRDQLIVRMATPQQADQNHNSQ